MDDDRLDRREFLRLAAGGAACAVAAGAGCSSGSDERKESTANGGPGAGNATARELRVATWSHFVPAYDAWFDNEFTKRWGEQHDVRVVVDHLPINELPIRGESEAAAKRGHDLFWFINPRAALEDDVIDHREVVEQVAGKLGKMVRHVERSVLNPKTGAFFAFPDHWTAAPVHYRVDLWDEVQPGLRPSTWDEVRRAGATLKARARCTYAVGSYAIWKFSANIDLAKQFLVDLSLSYRDAFLQSGFYNLPAFPGAVPDLADLVAKDPAARPQDKYALLGDAVDWTTNAGSPGYFNAAIDEAFNLFILSRMFSTAARGEKSPADAVAIAEAEMRPIFEKWRERGKI